MLKLNTPLLDENNVPSFNISFIDLKDDEGELILDKEGKPQKEKEKLQATLYRIIRKSLLKADGETDHDLIRRRFALFERINLKEEEEMEFDEKETELILDLIVRQYSTLFSGQVLKMFDNQ